MKSFIDQLCDAVLATDGGTGETRHLIGRTIADTAAVAAAGFAEPVLHKLQAAYAGSGAHLWNGAGVEGADAALLADATAAHALDFDDVYLDSGTHASAVIVPTALRLDRSDDADAVITACAAGLIAARAVGSWIGRGHYQRGWHATGTIGAFSAAATAARLVGLDAQRLRWAFGLAAAMSGGLQRNFSTMAKPAHAGFAASAGLRAVRLAEQGVTAAEDIFGPRGYGDLYGTGQHDFDDTVFALKPERIALKLYPCCYAANRLIGVALDLRSQVGPVFARTDVTMTLTTPRGSLSVLKYDRPEDDMQAKFSATFPTAVALIDGPPTLAHFTAQGVRRADIGDCMDRLTIVEDPDQDGGGGLEQGFVTLELFEGGSRTAKVRRAAIPGSDADPATERQVAVKAADCLAVYEKAFGHRFPLLARIRDIPEAARWLD